MYILVHKIKPENISDLYGRVSLRASLGIICKMTREMICINTSTLPDQMRDLTTAWPYPAGRDTGTTAVDARDPAVDRDLGWHWPADR